MTLAAGLSLTARAVLLERSENHRRRRRRDFKDMCAEFSD